MYTFFIFIKSILTGYPTQWYNSETYNIVLVTISDQEKEANRNIITVSTVK